jgi:hypothetical protein
MVKEKIETFIKKDDMYINSTIRQSHRTLSTSSLKFLEYAKTTPDCFKRSRFRELKWESHSLSKAILQPWPIFVSRKLIDSFIEASTNIFALICSIPSRLFNYDPVRISHFYELPIEKLKRSLYGIDSEFLKYLIGRGDFVFSSSGLKCLEINIASNFGGWEIAMWLPMYLENPILSEFIKKNNVKITNQKLLHIYFGNLINAALKFFPNDDEINIILQTWGGFKDEFTLATEKYANSIYKNVLKEKRKSKLLKGEVFFNTFSELDLKGEHLYYRDKKVHVAVEFSKHEVISADMLFLFKNRNILIFNGPVNFLLNNKLHLALLSEQQRTDTFTLEEREIIKKYIPWTRKLRPGSTTYSEKSVQLEDFVICNREKLVIKPAKGTSGGDVYIGNLTTGSQWRELISTALTDRRVWVVQEYIESNPMLFQAGENGCDQYNMVLGMFTFGSDYGGTWVRILPIDHEDGIISGGRGAQETIVLEVEE